MQQHSDRIEGQARSEQSPRVAPRVLGATVVTLAGGTLMVGGQPVQAADFSVTNLANAGAGSLRQAIIGANGAGGADTITFDPSLTGTITLASSLPTITGSVTIVGPGSSAVTIDANGNVDPIYVDSGSVALSISGLTIINAGGDGIDVNSSGGSLTLDDVVVEGAYDNGIEVDGVTSVTITDSEASYNGDPSHESIGNGLEATNVGSVTISGSTFHRNAYAGVDVDGASSVSVTTSAFTYNGFAFYNPYRYEYGSGIDLFDVSTVSITDSTVEYNYDDGIDLYNVDVTTMSGLTVRYNDDEGIEFDNPTEPATSFTFTYSTISYNGDNGIDGNDVVLVTLSKLSVTDNNDDGINTGDVTTFSLDTSTVSYNGDEGLDLDNGTTLTVDTSTVSNNGNEGIELDVVQTTTLTDVTVRYNDDEGLDVAGRGIYGDDAAIAVDAVTIVDSTFSYNGEEGIKIEDALSVTLTDVTVDENGEYGGVVDGDDFRSVVTVSGWSSSGNYSSGLYVSYVESVSVTNSSFTGDNNEGLEIYNVTGDVTMSGVTVTDAYGGPLYVTNVGGSVTVESSSFTGGRDQVYLYNIAGDLTLQDVEVSGTLDDDGIKIVDVRGETLLERVTVSDVEDDGIDVGAVSMTVLNSTITGAGESGIDIGIEVQDAPSLEVGSAIPAEKVGVGSTIVVEHSTITGNGEYGIGAEAYESGYSYSDGTRTYFSIPASVTITVDHSIVSGNGYGDVINLSEDNDAPDQGSTTVMWSLVDEDSEHRGGDNVEADDPMLGDLADNGGETLTMLPMSGSPAISAGDPSIIDEPDTDQRGVARVRNRIEIGAVEVDANQGVIEVQTPAAAGEAEGIPVTLVRTGGSDGPVSITLRSSCDGVERTVSWAAGESGPKTVTFPLPNNTSDDPDRVCTIEIVGSTNADAGLVASFPVTVTDLEDTAVPTLPPTGGTTGPFAALAGVLLAMGAAMSRIGRRRPV